MLCAENDLEGQLTRLAKAMTEGGVPEADRDRILGYTKGLFSKFPAEALPGFMANQVFIALGTTLLAAKSLGIDSCPVTGFDAAMLTKVLDLPAHIVPTALCPLGYGADNPSARVRFPLSQILI